MEEVALKFNQLIKRFKSRENGSVVESMIHLGLVYEKNFGVALSELNEIASDFKYDKEFAEFLWMQDIREAKIISLMIEDPKQINNNRVETILNGIDNIELAEQASINILQKIDGILYQINNWIKNDKDYHKITGLLLISRILKSKQKVKSDDLLEFFNNFNEIARVGNVMIINSLSKALLQIGKNSDKLEKTVLDFIANAKEKKYKSYPWLNEEVVYFLINK